VKIAMLFFVASAVVSQLSRTFDSSIVIFYEAFSEPVLSDRQIVRYETHDSSAAMRLLDGKLLWSADVSLVANPARVSITSYFDTNSTQPQERREDITLFSSSRQCNTTIEFQPAISVVRTRAYRATGNFKNCEGIPSIMNVYVGAAMRGHSTVTYEFNRTHLRCDYVYVPPSLHSAACVKDDGVHPRTRYEFSFDKSVSRQGAPYVPVAYMVVI